MALYSPFDARRRAASKVTNNNALAGQVQQLPPAGPASVPATTGYQAAPAVTGPNRAAVRSAQTARVTQTPTAAPVAAAPAAAPVAGGFQTTPGASRVAPQYVPRGTYQGPTDRLDVQWDYKSSPEYQFRLDEAQKALNRQLASRGRSNSTFGVNALAKQAALIAGEEVDKQYARARSAEQENYGRGFTEEGVGYGRGFESDRENWGRYLGSEGINYGRDVSEDERAYGRFWNEDDREFNRNALLTQMGQRAAELASGQGIGYGRDVMGQGNLYTNQLLNMLLGYGDAMGRNEWQYANPYLDMLGQGGMNNALLWANMGALPMDIMRLMGRGGRGYGGGSPGGVPYGDLWNPGEGGPYGGIPGAGAGAPGPMGEATGPIEFMPWDAPPYAGLPGYEEDLLQYAYR